MHRAISWRGLLAGALIFACALAARADDTAPAESPIASSKPPEQWLYKGLVGNALDLVPLDPEIRVDLQRANAVVGTPLSARSLALLLGVASPALMVPGLIWGIWAALNIKPDKPDMRWLGSRRGKHGVGFCTRAHARSCELQLQDFAALPRDGDPAPPHLAADEPEPATAIAQAE